MGKEIIATKVEGQLDYNWLDDVDSSLPDELHNSQKQGKLPPKLLKKKITLKVRNWITNEEVKFKALLNDTLGEVFAKAAEVLKTPLLPPLPNQPLDVLRCQMQHKSWEIITNLDEPLWIALIRGCKRNFAIEYKLIVKINSQWGIAPSKNATPRELLTQFGMDAQEFTLYPTDSSQEYPVDTPLNIKRGDMFEAQKDGRYGDPFTKRSIRRGSQTIEDDVSIINEVGGNARLLKVGEQKYVEVKGLDIPSPPWRDKKTDILIAIPNNYPSGGLDAFYIGLPMQHDSGSIPYQQGETFIDGRSWMLISWHYHPSHPWNPLQDDLESHIQQCRGFFLTRGVRQ